MPRVWSMRFNSDGFNHAYAGLDTDEEKAQFVTGFYRGTNGVPLKEGQPSPMLTGHAFGLKMREEAEASLAQAAINGAKRGKGKGTQEDPSRVPGGELEGASGEAPGSTEGPGLRFKVQGFPDQEKPVLRLEPVPSPAPKPSKDPILRDACDQCQAAWNKALAPLGFGECLKLADSTDRSREIQKRLKADPDFVETFQKAVAQIASDPYWKGKGGYISIDYLLRPGKAQEFAEKPIAGKAGQGPAHRAEVDSGWDFPERVIHA
ncbi:hypothetical protein [Geothrix sp. SG200]|uniref:hypothetical protein n=1 Tax=Geothrix sp. SG200 TaxID=2922865 RepID=UPI001FAC8FF4|nr:hypothetical protein [Geothrix sp. SG200]